MKQIISILFFYFAFFVVCSSQSAAQDNSKSKFTLTKVSVQNTVPGIENVENTYFQQWIIYLKGPSNPYVNLDVLLNTYVIESTNLGTKGIALGSDSKEYVIKFDVTYPLDKHYNKKEGELNNKPQIHIKTEGNIQVLFMDNIDILEAIVYPSKMN
jgi:hypothetical protein